MGVQLIHTMAFVNKSKKSQDGNSAVTELLEKNLLTTAGVVAGGLTVSYGAMVVTAALPVKMIGGAAVCATLMIAGDQQAKGNLKMPSFGKKQQETTAQES